jgi:hypothetical protein
MGVRARGDTDQPLAYGDLRSDAGSLVSAAGDRIEAACGAVQHQQHGMTNPKQSIQASKGLLKESIEICARSDAFRGAPQRCQAIACWRPLEAATRRALYLEHSIDV